MADLQNSVWFWLGMMALYFGVAVTLALTVHYIIGLAMAIVFVFAGSAYFFIPSRR